MNSSINVTKYSDSNPIEIEMTDYELAEDNCRISNPEFINLMPMQPVDEKLQQMIEKEDYSEVTAGGEKINSKPTEEEIFPTVVAEAGISFCTIVDEGPLNRNVASTHKHTQEEIINQLLEDKISFSQVAELLGDDNEENDLENELLNEPSLEDVDEDQNIEDHAVEFEKELSEQQRYHLKRKGGKEKRRRRRLPAALQGLMGEANLRYARCEYDEAIKMCMEVIRQYSSSPEPYQTLGMIYEDKKMVNKSLQFLLIAAFLSSSAEEWEKLAELSTHQLGDIRQAVFCWGRAIRANPQNLDYHWARCDLLEQLGEKTKAFKGYIHMVKFLRPDQGQDGLKLAKEIAKIHYENGNIHLAQEAMETAFKKYPAFVTAEDTNLMLEVLMHRELYSSCVIILMEHMKIRLFSQEMSEEAFDNLSSEERVRTATLCVVPPELPNDLKAKLVIAFINLKKIELVEPLVEALTKEPVDVYGDLYLEIAEAYLKVGNHISAIPILEILLQTESFERAAAVWLLYGECLAASSRLDEAAVAYEQVVVLAPQHGEARLTLSSILQTLGRTDEALVILNQEDRKEPVDSNLLYRKCTILFTQGKLEDFIKTALLLFKRHFVNIRNREEAEALLGNKKLSNKYEALRDLRRSKKEKIEDERPEYVKSDVPVIDQWNLFLRLCEVLFELRRMTELERLTFSALGSREFMKEKERAKEVEFLCLLSCLNNESFYFAYNITRELILKNPENNRCWNLLCYIISKADDFRHNKFLLRLTHKYPDSLPLMMLNGHNCLVAGTYKFSLAEYTASFKQDPHNPLIPLMLGLIFTHMACQKFSGKKHSLVVQACAFLNTYLEMRKECQESLYNLGRAMHQLNLLPQAIHYYKRALEMPRPVLREAEPELDLRLQLCSTGTQVRPSTKDVGTSPYTAGKRSCSPTLSICASLDLSTSSEDELFERLRKRAKLEVPAFNLDQSP